MLLKPLKNDARNEVVRAKLRNVEPKDVKTHSLRCLRETTRQLFCNKKFPNTFDIVISSSLPLAFYKKALRIETFRNHK